MDMKFPAKLSGKRRVLTACLIALSFIGPVFGSSRSARAADDDLQNDARLEGYMGRTVVLDTGVATDYMLLGGLTILIVCVMLKDARRSHKKS
ncbi:MAG TPA: hypothetical protein VFE47_19000 [Tepidisphaeraceae bacterium]|jgi:hypothetical protein|nr:hypothetical protein [Tepidisphaeraceae bacterium]